MKVLIIGGVAAGATAAARLRRQNKDAEIVIAEQGGYVSFAACGLPYYIGGRVSNMDEILMQTPEGLREKYNIDVRINTKATSINTAEKTATLQKEGGEEYTEKWDKLLLATGASPFVPPLAGTSLPGVFTLHSVEDAHAIKLWINTHKPKDAVIIGCGAIGLEVAENLAGLGISVTAADKSPQVLPFLDEGMAARVQAHAEQNGISFRLGTLVKSINTAQNGLVVQLEDESLAGGIVILAMGIRPNSGLAKNAGLKLDEQGYIIVNDHMQTSHPDIYAAGDVASVKSAVTGAGGHFALAGPANRQGRIAADSLAGRRDAYGGAQGSAIVQVFGFAAAATGLTEKQAQAAGLNYGTAEIESASHAEYYPGAEPLYLKAVYDKTSGVIIGAQVAGKKGADKRADVLAAAINAKMTADQLAELDLCYAPQFSSPKDPVNILANIVQRGINSGGGAAKSISEIVQAEFIEKNLNCAESTVLALQKTGALPQDDILVKSMACFGGGLGRGQACGAVLGALAALGAQKGRGAAGGSGSAANSAKKEFLEKFEARFGCLGCDELRAKKEGHTRQNCAEYVAAAAEIAAEILKEN